MNWTQKQLDQYLGKGGKAEVLSGNGDARPKQTKMPVARTRLKVAEPNFRSKTERRAWEDYLQWLPEPYLSKLVKMEFEPIVFHLSGGNYTPDFMLVFDDGEMWFIEVKGSWKAYQSGRSSKRNLRQAAAEFGWMGRFFALMPRGNVRWQLEEFTDS